ncbi:MAG: vWA domain-containing protein [Ardenticatenales bacterium]
MMNGFTIRRALGAMLVAAATALATTSAHPTAHAAPSELPQASRLLQGPTPTADPDKTYYYLGGYAPCNLRGTHTVTPPTVEEGKNVTIHVEFSFNCGTEEIKKVDMVLMVENTGSLKLNNVSGKQQPLENLKLGLSNLARNIDPLNGSRVGLVQYGCDTHTNPPIGDSQEHYDRWRDAIQKMSGNLNGGSNPGTALRASSGQIASLSKPDPYDPPSFIVIIDAGGVPCNGAPRPQAADIADACDAAKSNQATVVLVALRPSQGRLRGCNTPGWYFRSSNDNGTDLPQILNDIKDRIFKGARPNRTAYDVFLNTYLWEYMAGTGIPRDADITFPDIAWEEDLGTRRKATFSYQYELRAREGSAPAPWSSISVPDGGIPSPLIEFLYNDGTSDQIVIPESPLCIYRPNKEAQDCGAFVSQMTATAVAAAQTASAPTPTPPPTAVETSTPGGPTETPTDVPPMETPTDTPTEVPTVMGATDTPPPPIDTATTPPTQVPPTNTSATVLHVVYLPLSYR